MTQGNPKQGMSPLVLITKRALAAYTAGVVITAAGIAVLVTALTVGGKPGPAGQQGEPGRAGQNYVLTEKDKAEVAGYVTPVPGPQGLKGDTGATGPQGIQGKAGEPAPTPDLRDYAKRSDLGDYVKRSELATPTATVKPSPTATIVVPTSTPTATPQQIKAQYLNGYLDGLLSDAAAGKVVGMAFYNDPAGNCFKTVAYSFVKDSNAAKDVKTQTFVFNSSSQLLALAAVMGADKLPEVTPVKGKVCADELAYNGFSHDSSGLSFTNVVAGKRYDLVARLEPAKLKYGPLAGK